MLLPEVFVGTNAIFMATAWPKCPYNVHWNTHGRWLNREQLGLCAYWTCGGWRKLNFFVYVTSICLPVLTEMNRSKRFLLYCSIVCIGIRMRLNIIQFLLKKANTWGFLDRTTSNLFSIYNFFYRSFNNKNPLHLICSTHPPLSLT